MPWGPSRISLMNENSASQMICMHTEASNVPSYAQMHVCPRQLNQHARSQQQAASKRAHWSNVDSTHWGHSAPGGPQKGLCGRHCSSSVWTSS